MAATQNRLSLASLTSLPKHVGGPGYDPTKVSAGIVHIGTSGFAMSHLGSYINEVLKTDPTWGIVAVFPRSRRALDSLNAQDKLYVLVEREQDKKTASVLAPIVQTLF